ncbi:hypothetical protein [Dysgonomonas sp. 25]|uniref:hypothetical protein n=1 Tax=Dysgonomonas sp. 25 TaxID=2302933 RepID=UPI0013D516BC|nr:hypothetical protein [Dysgonomonas sp. 25]NDV68636.1 hypothetical protein [Dysgonomonas sp. 25]
MPQFNFYQDRKLIIWERTHFTIEAENEEEAIKKFESENAVYIENMNETEKGKSEILSERTEILTMDDNNGFATIEIYIDNNSSDNLIYHNGIDIEDR